jgi:hypothetical protein
MLNFNIFVSLVEHFAYVQESYYLNCYISIISEICHVH